MPNRYISYDLPSICPCNKRLLDHEGVCTHSPLVDRVKGDSKLTPRQLQEIHDAKREINPPWDIRPASVEDLRDLLGSDAYWEIQILVLYLRTLYCVTLSFVEIKDESHQIKCVRTDSRAMFGASFQTCAVVVSCTVINSLQGSERERF
jgi:hypothetical protein